MCRLPDCEQGRIVPLHTTRRTLRLYKSRKCFWGSKTPKDANCRPFGIAPRKQPLPKSVRNAQQAGIFDTAECPVGTDFVVVIDLFQKFVFSGICAKKLGSLIELRCNGVRK